MTDEILSDEELRQRTSFLADWADDDVLEHLDAIEASHAALRARVEKLTKALARVEWRGPPYWDSRGGEYDVTCPNCGQPRGRALTARHKPGCALDEALQ